MKQYRSGMYILQKIENCSVAQSKLFRRLIVVKSWNAKNLQLFKILLLTTHRWFFGFSKHEGETRFFSIIFYILTCKPNDFSFFSDVLAPQFKIQIFIWSIELFSSSNICSNNFKLPEKLRWFFGCMYCRMFFIYFAILLDMSLKIKKLPSEFCFSKNWYEIFHK